MLMGVHWKRVFKTILILAIEALSNGLTTPSSSSFDLGRMKVRSIGY
jgi:hypothetical protein